MYFKGISIRLKVQTGSVQGLERNRQHVLPSKSHPRASFFILTYFLKKISGVSGEEKIYIIEFVLYFLAAGKLCFEWMQSRDPQRMEILPSNFFR